MKRSFCILITVLLFTSGYSQSHFREIIENLDQNDRFSNMMNLRLYQEIYPDRAITYFLLGNIFEKYMMESDPLLRFEVLEIYHNQFNIYFGLIKLKLDNKQANQDRDYYGDIKIITDKRKAGLPDILNEIERRITEENKYYTRAKDVHDNYIKCITKYNACLFEYRKINRVYPDIKTLFLMATPQIKSEIEGIALDFDSALIYFDAYKNACKKIPQHFKVNDYELSEIVTYRLEGLTETDFTSGIVRLWNFKSWAQHFLQRMDSDISAIRTGIEESDKRLTRQTEKLKTEPVYYEEPPYDISYDKLHYLTGKYDYASITNELLAYKKSKIGYLQDTRSGMNNPHDTTDFEIISKLMFYKDLADTKVALNDQVDRLKKRISIENTSKYMKFFFDQYKGMEGFSRWCEKEKYDNELIFDYNLSNLNGFINQTKHKHVFSDSLITFNKRKIPFGIQQEPVAPPHADTLITRGVHPFLKRWHFLDGYEFKKDGSKIPFLCKINPQGKADWMIFPELKGTKSAGSGISSAQLLDDSTCWLLSNAVELLKDSVRQHTTYLTRINWKGKIMKQSVLAADQHPAYFWVDEINEQYLLVLRKGAIGREQPGLHQYQVRLYNFNDSLAWQTSFSLDGQFLDVIHSNSNLYLLCQYKRFEMTHGNKTTSLTSGNSGIAGIYLQRTGEVSHINDYKMENEISGVYCKKVYDNSITLFGKIKEATSGHDSYFFILTDNRGTPVYTNIK